MHLQNMDTLMDGVVPILFESVRCAVKRVIMDQGAHINFSDHPPKEAAAKEKEDASPTIQGKESQVNTPEFVPVVRAD
jgi:hypothetical protein